MNSLNKTLKKIQKNQFLKENFAAVIFFALIISFSTFWAVGSAVFYGDFELARENFSISGSISEIDNNFIKISGEDDNGKESEKFNINIEHLKIVQTEEYTEISINDLEAGDPVVIQGVTYEKYYFAKRIIYLGDKEIDAIVAEELTATTTDDVATSTDETATSTEENSSSESENTSSTDQTQETETSPATSTNSTLTDDIESSETIDNTIQEGDQSDNDSASSTEPVTEENPEPPAEDPAPEEPQPEESEIIT